MVKNPPASAEDAGSVGSILGLGRCLAGGHGNPTPVFLPGASRGQRSLVAVVHGVAQRGTLGN